MKSPMARLSIGLQLTISMLLFLLPVSVMMSFIISGMQATMRFTALEIEGNVFLRPLVDLIASATEAQLTAAKGGDVSSPDQIKNMDGMKTAMDTIAGNFAVYGDELQFTDDGLLKRHRETVRFDTLQKLHASYVTALQGQDNDARLKALDELIKMAREMIRHAGDTSNLILDPDLDTYYLMDVVLLALPDHIDRLRGYLTQPDELTQKTDVAKAFLRTVDGDRIDSSTQTSMNEDANFYGPKPGFDSIMLSALTAYNAALVPAISYFDADHLYGLFTASVSMWRSGSDQLAGLFDMRMAFFNKQLVFALLLSLAAIAVAALVQLLILRGIRFRIGYIQKTVGSIVESKDLTGSIDIRHAGIGDSTELGRLVMSFNNLTSVFRQDLIDVRKSERKVRDLSVEAVKITDSEMGEKLGEIQNSMDTIGESSRAVNDEMETLNGALSQIMESIDRTSHAIVEQRGVIEAIESDIGRLEGTQEMLRGLIVESRDMSASLSAEAKRGEDSAESTYHAMESVSQFSEEVKSLVTLIAGIAAQTNLLAMNAAIEAAHAGDAGRGFSVVASEIRSLAESTRSSSGKIQNMLKLMMEQISKAAKAAFETRESLRGVAEHAARTDSVVQNLSGAVSSEQEDIEKLSHARQTLTKTYGEIAQAAGQEGRAAAELPMINHRIRDRVESSAEQVQVHADALKALIESLHRVVMLIEENRNRGQELESIVGKFRVEDGQSA